MENSINIKWKDKINKIYLIIFFQFTFLFVSISFCVKSQSSIIYSYDSLNRLIKVFYENDNVFSFHYDELGNRIDKAIINPFIQTIELKVMFEGPFNAGSLDTYINLGGYIPLSQPYNTSPWNYNGTEGVTAIPNSNIVDWILIELRETTGGASTATSDSIIAQRAGFILNDGTIVDRDGVNPIQIEAEISDNLYVVVWHRNHIGIMSANPLNEVDDVYTYDFTSSSGQAYGINAQKELAPSIWGMFAADGNADGSVNTADKEIIWEPQAGDAGYKSGDFNLDVEVNNQDKNEFWVPNMQQESQVPD